MKRYFLLSAALMLGIMLSAQTLTQKGVSYKYNGKSPRTLLPNVTIECISANSAVVSDSTGSFSLVFNKLKMGDRMGSVTVRKREMMVFNQQAVDEWSIRKEPLCLILCDAKEFERQKQELIDIGKSEAEKKYNRQKAELEKQLEASQIDRARYEAELDKAWDELDRLHKHIDEYADLFARIDESEIDSLAQQAMDLFNQGKVDEAVRLFEQGNYLEKLKQDNRAIEQAEQLIEATEQAKAKAKEEKEMHLNSLMAQIKAYKMQNEWKKASNLLKGLADELNTYESLFEYALFCQKQNDFKEAEEYYQKALPIIRQLSQSEPSHYEPDLAMTLNDLALLYRSTRRFSECETLHQEALEIYKRLAKDDPTTYNPKIALTVTHLGICCAKNHRFSEAEELYLEALKTYKKSAERDPQSYKLDIANLLNNIALLYSNTQRLSESESYYLEAVQLYRELAKDNSKAHEPNLALTLSNFAYLYSNTQRLEESEDLYNEAISIRERLAEENPKKYKPALAQTYGNLAILYAHTKRFSESEAMYQKALQTYRELAEDNPQAHEPVLSLIMNNLASLYHDIRRFEECENLHKEALLIRKRLAKENPNKYGPALAQTLSNLAILYSNTQRFSESDVMYQEALQIDRMLVKENPKAFEPDLALTLVNTAVLYSRIQRNTESETSYLEAIGIYRRLVKDNPKAYEPFLAATLFNLGVLYKDSKRFSESETMYLEALEIRRRLAQANPPVYEPKVAQTLNNLANLYKDTKRFGESEAMHIEALEIYKKLAEEDPESYNPMVAQSAFNFGSLKELQHKDNEAIILFEKSLLLCQENNKKDSIQQRMFEDNLYHLSKLYGKVGDYQNCLAKYETYLTILKGHDLIGSEEDSKKYVDALDNYALQCIYAKQFEKSEQLSKKALSFNPNNLTMYCRLSVSLLFQGKNAEAEAVYRQYKDELKDNFLQDFSDFEAAGVIPEERKVDVERIRKMLTQE